MRKFFFRSMLLAYTIIFSVLSQAQSLDERATNFQKRIDKGVSSGGLSRDEAARLQERLNRFIAEKSAARSDGKLSDSERAKLNAEAEGISKSIKMERHNEIPAEMAEQQGVAENISVTEADDGAIKSSEKSKQSDAASQVNSVKVVDNDDLSETVKTVAGDLSIKKKSDDYYFAEVILNGRVVFNSEENILSIEKVFNFNKKTVILFSWSGGGTACPGTFSFLTVRQDGGVVDESGFGNCSDLADIEVNGESVIVTLPDLRERGDESWEYKNDRLTQIKTIDPNIEKNADRIALDDESVPIILKGSVVSKEIISEEDGKSSRHNFLKLAKKTIIECGDRWPVRDEVPISDEAEIPSAAGESEYEVMMACPYAGSYIVAIKPSDKSPTGNK